MNFNSCSEDYLSQCSGTLIVRERFQEEFDRFPDVGEDLLDGPALRLAPLEFRAPSVTAVLILLNYDTDFARHDLILTEAEKRILFSRGYQQRAASASTTPHQYSAQSY